ncbi:MAG TPA: hypothetical protein VMT69_06295, partial [Kineosporiaceae bacterium]|nr:hypothetical protein [Kineosporiaceae bacterium]
LSLHGEVQKEVVAALLEERYGVRARFAETSTLCIERVLATGSSIALIGQRGNPYLAGVGLHMPAAFIAATARRASATASARGCTHGR